MYGFKNVILDCDFIDFPISGPYFNCSRGDGDDAFYERLDRFLSAQE